jgi:hypothetical protein
MNAVQKLLRRTPRKPTPGPRPPSAPANGAAPVAPVDGAILNGTVNARKKVLREAPGWTEHQAERALRAAGEASSEPDESAVEAANANSHVPEALRFFSSGRPQPDWTAIIRRDRELGHGH